MCLVRVGCQNFNTEAQRSHGGHGENLCVLCVPSATSVLNLNQHDTNLTLQPFDSKSILNQAAFALRAAHGATKDPEREGKQDGEKQQ